MGKKNKETSKEDFRRGLMSPAYGPGKEAREMLKRYNVEGYSHGRTDRGSEYRGVDEVEKDLANAMMNDYDTRRTMEAAAMAGNKDAKKFAKKGFKPGNLQDAYGVMRDLKKEYVGGGGMNGAKNRAGLTYAAVKEDRKNFTEDIKGMIPEQAPDSSTADNVDEKKEVVLSEHMQKAKNIVDQYESGYTPVYNPEAREAQKTGISINDKIDVANVGMSSEDQAQDFLANKTNKAKDEFRFARVY